MELRFWGVRGTFPALGKKASAFGRSTPCATVTSGSGGIIIIDAGTGMQALGNELASKARPAPLGLSLLLTHFHLDHLSGLPFFKPLFSPGTEIAVYTPVEPDAARRYLGLLIGHPFFPAPFEQTAANKRFGTIGAAGISIGDARITTCPLHHPQGSVAYRLEEKGVAVVFATDTEPPEQKLDGRLAAFAKGADVLIYDAMFKPEEYASEKKGWGHSTWLDGVKMAQASGARRLVLAHLNPDYSDRDLRAIERRARRMFPNAECAREGGVHRF